MAIPEMNYTGTIGYGCTLCVAQMMYVCPVPHRQADQSVAWVPHDRVLQHVGSE